MTSGQPVEADKNNPAYVNGNTEDNNGLRQRCAEVHAAVEAFLQKDYAGDDEHNARLRRTQEQVKISLNVIADALDRYTLDELSLSYNGGKDCLVLLLLYLAGLHRKTLTTPTYTLPLLLPSVYITLPEPFPAVTHFVTSSSAHYHIHLTAYPSVPSMRAAFDAYLTAHPRIRAIFVGTRRTDPHGGQLTFFDATDRGWPAFMRVHPVIDWHYAEIWAFIRELGVEYCALYDQGYTSLGGIGDTKPNPALREGKEVGGFRPAYELLEDEEERLGRD